ncbi:MAG: sigma 54-interacting transcriptional regulator [Acidaminococcus sp.]|uniref:Sigma 54-interacting transcriptional regulator n=1 Tax=Acidaminococcus intestini TaxID=187327 RepID=A0A943EB22_9FIRM|nr:sigma 54-interacting transcriptional regulator [Acidaminococcus sp.]MBS5518847.1 sigma 54-interacting transcriptional regulator [Acidaminococcus intestini]MDY2739005.1 sigma 54-interacting transcriptional regulator [Acidaminococcus sp.]
MKWQEVMAFLDQFDRGAMLVREGRTIVEINEFGRNFLGLSQTTGAAVPEKALPLLRPLEAKQVAHLAFQKWARRVKCGPVTNLPEETELVVFEDAACEVYREMYQNILNRISESVILCDENEQILFLNDAAVRMDSLLNEAVVGRSMDEVYKSENDVSLLLPKVLKSEKPHLNQRQQYETFNGKEVDIVSDNYPIFKNSQVLGAYSVMEDFSQLDSLHRKILELQDELLRQDAQIKGKKSHDSVLHAKYHFEDIISSSRAMRVLVERCKQVAKSSSSVMIYGETGTGKELFAQSIHNASSRAAGPFLAINCAAIPENLLEGLLFGTEKGAYTGAESHPGLFEQANGGTLLLDEINSMNINLQPKLLRVLQEGTVRRVGSTRERKVDVRVLSNINIPPEEALTSHKLRQDLYYRLGVVGIRIPPLRERKEDIPLLVQSFIARYNKRLERNVQGVDSHVLDIFAHYDWPGNVRELQHAIEYAMNLLPEKRTLLTVECLPEHFVNLEVPQSADPLASSKVMDTHKGSLRRKTLRDVERAALVQALKRTGGNISAAARELGMSRQNLQYHIKRDRINLEK